jgi:2,4-dienoyl-CoA reductase-like NADH-dependent reductase (Old Yellow Enzyme family)
LGISGDSKEERMDASAQTGRERWPNLFSPARFCGLSLANRLAVAPMTRISATEDGCATPEMAEYYAEYARGGFALVISEATYVDEAHSQGFWGQPGIANSRQRDAWRPVVDAVLSARAKRSLIRLGVEPTKNGVEQG